MTGIVDAGGGLRGIYGAGVFDYCLDHGIRFDYCIGVSAGSANIASYLGGQKGRNYRFYMEYSFGWRYLCLANLLHSGSYLDLDYVYGELSGKSGENPLDFDEIKSSRSIMKVVALNALTGETIYFDKNDMAQDNYNILKASSCIPVVCRPYSVKGIPCFDGGMADPVPVEKAFRDGCDRVAVILTKPADFVRVQTTDARFVKLLRHRYAKAAENLSLRYKKYNEGVASAKQYAQRGKALIIAPDNCCGMKTLTRSRKSMDKMYHKGYADAQALQNFMGNETDADGFRKIS